jgi:hypothetical protein
MRWSDVNRRGAAARRGVVAVGALALGAGANLAAAARAIAATPSPTTALGGDPRSSGQGPGLVGDPLLAIVIVVGIGLLALAATLLYVRMTGGPRRR